MASKSGDSGGEPEHDFFAEQLTLSIGAYNAAAASYNRWLDAHRDRREYHDLNRLYLVSDADVNAIAAADTARIAAVAARLHEGRDELDNLLDEDRRLDPYPINEAAATLVARWQTEVLSLLRET